MCAFPITLITFSFFCVTVWFMGAPDPPIQTQNSFIVNLMLHHTPCKDMQQIIIQELLDRAGHGAQEGA